MNGALFIGVGTGILVSGTGVLMVAARHRFAQNLRSLPQWRKATPRTVLLLGAGGIVIGAFCVGVSVAAMFST